ncbi:MAG: hypothetical protein ACR2OZ_18650 [Verrucomicrobiales bacterium]
MSDWLIKKISAAPQARSLGAWPECQTYTVQNIKTGEIQEITCCGSSQVEGLIEDRNFDIEPLAHQSTAKASASSE